MNRFEYLGPNNASLVAFSIFLALRLARKGNQNGDCRVPQPIDASLINGSSAAVGTG